MINDRAILPAVSGQHYPSSIYTSLVLDGGSVKGKKPLALGLNVGYNVGYDPYPDEDDYDENDPDDNRRTPTGSS